MILVVTEQLNLNFLLQHQGKFIRSARSATDALRILRSDMTSIQGVVLDERISASRLVSGYVRTHVPGIQLVSWHVAQRHSPFRTVGEEGSTANRTANEYSRYVWDKAKAL